MSRGSVPADIESIVNDLKSITLEQVIFEAITNSIQANATEIEIKFTNQNEVKLENINKYIDSLIIEDNGDGFTPENTESFGKYRSTYKRHLGAKGIGRFLFLKIFQTINIESLNKKITFVKDKDIDVKKWDQNEFEKTTVYFKNPVNSFSVNYRNLEQKIKDHFLAYFKLLNEKENRKLIIKIFEDEVEKIVITNNNLLKFETVNFKIHDHDFILDYVLNDENIKENEGFYCAGNRVVIKNSDLDTKKKLKLFSNIKISYLLFSKYLDENVDDNRDDFSTIKPILTHKEIFHDLSWKDIQSEISNQIKRIAKENNIDIDEVAKENLNKSRIKAPYLADYLRNNKNAYCTDDLIENALKQFTRDKKIIRDSKSKLDDSYQEKIGIVTHTELAEYIFDRQKIIENLKQLTGNNALEKEIHNLFMKQRTSDTDQDYRSNNLWLFDDRFMLYDKVFSEKQIKEIFPELSDNMRRPDILSIVSNTYDKNSITDIVIIELKKPDENITTEGAEAQLLRYSRFINQSNIKNKVRIWTYAFLKFSDEVGEDLDDKDYNKIPTQHKHPIYYKYHEKRNTIINFMDYRSLAYDADNRNRIFMEILKGETLQR